MEVAGSARTLVFLSRLALVKPTPYEQHRDYVLAVLRRRCGWLGDDEREAIFHEAYAVFLEKQRDRVLDVDQMHSQQVRAYLTQTSIHKALDEGKRAERNRSTPLGDTAFAEPDPARAPDDRAAANLDGARVREIVGELSPRRQAIIKLRFFFDRTPDEIQRLLGLSERAYRRDLERAVRHIAQRYELVEEGLYCESRRSLVLAYVAGVAGPNRAREARAHLATCPGCSHWAASLRESARGAAALAPLPALVHGSGLSRAFEGLAAAKVNASQLAAGLKQHATMVGARVDAASAGYTSAVRPGAVVAAVAGCIAVGSGATYCAVQGVPPPIRSLIPDAPAHVRSKSHAAQAEPEQAPEPAPPPALTSPPPPPDAEPEPEPAPPPTPEQEFGLSGSAQPVDPGSAAPAPTPSPSAPPGPPAEFGP